MAVLSVLTLQIASADLLTLLGSLATLYLARLIVLIIYRLYFHPLAHIPGPWLARCSHLWEFYYNVYHSGTRVHQLPGLHARYGPVVRISPREVHIASHVAYVEAFSPGHAGFQKDLGFYSTLGPSTASLTLIDPAASRTRRELLGPLFSKRAVLGLEPLIMETVHKLMGKLKEFRPEEPVPLQSGLYATTIDAISVYCFGRKACLNVLSAPGFKSTRLDELLSVSEGVWLGYHFPWIQPIALALPRSISRILAPGAIGLIENCEQMVKAHLAENKGDMMVKPDISQQRTVFDVLTSVTATKNRVLSYTELLDEGIILLLAGTDTTANTLAFAVYYFLKHPACAARVLAEIDAVPTDATSTGDMALTDLEQCQYFLAFLKETLRYSHAVPGKSPRVVPAGKNWEVPESGGIVLPPGTAIAFSPMMMHNDPSIFSEPEKFDPERWLAGPGEEPRGQSEKHIYSFSKGNRGCLGERLAWAEMFLVLGHLFRRVDMELYQTGEKEMSWRDMGISHTHGKLRVRIKSWREV